MRVKTLSCSVVPSTTKYWRNEEAFRAQCTVVCSRIGNLKSGGRCERTRQAAQFLTSEFRLYQDYIKKESTDWNSFEPPKEG